MFSCLQILEAFLWFVLITLLNVTLIILTLSVSRLLNLLLRLVAFLLFLNPQCLASISRWIRSEERFSRNAETDTLSLHDALPILIILTLSVSRLLNLLLRLVAFLLFLNPQCLVSISRWITASSSWKRFCLFVCRVMSLYLLLRS